MSQSPTESTKALMSTRRSTTATRRSPSPRTLTGVTSPPSTATPSAGILRISNKPRRASGSSVEFRVPPEQQLQTEPASPQPSVDRLSVSFAADFPVGGGSGSTPGGSGSGSVAQTSPVAATPTGLLTRSGCIMGVSGTTRGQRPPPLTLNGTDFKNRLSAETSDLGEEDEDYSASLSAIIQRRASTRRHSRRRRPSSPFSPGGVPGGVAGGVAAAAQAGTPTAAPSAVGIVATPSTTPATRRRSSVFTTSSADTGASGDTDSQEQIMENLRLHKEVLWGVKQQPWGMRRKLKLVRQAKTYVKRHEGQLQQRRATRDVLARFNLFLLKRWQRFRREFANLLNVLLPWEATVKEIESHFGSVVASYFTFLRWLCWVNLVITVVTIAFIVVPEVLTDDFSTAGERKEMLPEERRNATHLATLWDFGGILKYSPIFYGYYRNKEGRTGYRVPFAYFMTGLGLYVYSFVAILRKMAANSRMSKLSEKDDECVFTWKLFTGWDYMIGNAETAHNKVASTILGFKEALLEEAEKQREKRNWRIITVRILVNVSVTILLATSAFAVVFAVQRSTEKDAESTLWRRNETTVIINIVNFVFPMMFELLGMFERYHPRKTLRLQLARIMLLNLLNLYTFIFSTFKKITDMTKELTELEEVHKNHSEFFNFTAISCPCKGSSTLVAIAATTLAMSGLSPTNITSTSIAPSLSTTHGYPTLTPPITILTTFSSFDSTKFTPPPSITTKSTPASTSTKTYTSASTRTLTSTSTRISSSQTTQSTPTGLDESSSFSFDSTSTISPTSSEDDLNLTDTLFQSLVVNHLNSKNLTADIDKLHSGEPPSPTLELPGAVDQFDENELDNEIRRRFPVPIEPVAMLLGNRYLHKRSADESSNETVYESSTASADFGDSSNSTDLDVTGNSTGFPVEVSRADADDTNSSVMIDEDSFSVTPENDNTLPPLTTANTLPSTRTPLTRSTKTTSASTTRSTKPAIPNQSISKLTTAAPTSFRTTLSSDFTTSFPIGLDKNASFINLTTLTPISTDASIFTELNITAINISAIPPELICFQEQCEGGDKHNFKRRSNIDLKTRRQLQNLCWETMFGQELVKMTVMDLVMTIGSTLSVDFFRAVFVRVMNNCWCWDLEKKFPQYGDFKIAENILHLVNNQGMVWMGMFFSPGLALINLVKLAVMMYLRSWAVLTCNVPHEVVFRASRSNNFYYALLLTMLFLCVLPVGYAVVRLTPSWHCGPFSGYTRTYIIFTDSLRAFVPGSLHVVLDYVASPGIVIPLLLLLSLVIYYLISLTNSLREANNDLKIQLRRERTEERRRMFQLVERRKRGATGSADLADKWKKLIPTLPSTRDEESTIDQPSGGTRPDNAARRKELLTRLLKHALRKSSATSDEESGAGAIDPEADGDGTDAEQPDSLPEDAPAKPSTKSGRSTISQTVDVLRRIRRQPQPSPPQPQAAQPAQPVTSPTASSHREREDSVASAWSDNIPVIRISKTESTDCVVDVDQDEENPTGSSDTVVAADGLAEDEKHQRKKAMGRAILREAKRRRDSTRDDSAKDDPVRDNKDDLECAVSS